MIKRVDLTASARKDLRKVPLPIVTKFRAWVDDVEHKAWRAIYEIRADGAVDIVEVQEVNKHDY